LRQRLSFFVAQKIMRHISVLGFRKSKKLIKAFRLTRQNHVAGLLVVTDENLIALKVKAARSPDGLVLAALKQLGRLPYNDNSSLHTQ
jgi:hypothetical protein